MIIFKLIHAFFLNKGKKRDESYFLNIRIRFINSIWGLFFKLYYRYIAFWIMAKPARLKKGDKVLDIGCGIGILVEQFNKLGYKAVGVDVVEGAIKNSICPESCFLVKTTAKLDYPDNNFDLVVSREVLEHIPENHIDFCIKEWDRVCKGKMVHIIAVKERGESAIADPTHVNVKSEKWWIEKFKKYGYRAIKSPQKLFFSPFGNKGYFMFVKS